MTVTKERCDDEEEEEEEEEEKILDTGTGMAQYIKLQKAISRFDTG